jgi:hypothetical protein
MVDYTKELGPSLSKLLKELQSANGFTVTELATSKNISQQIAQDRLETLYSLGYIMDKDGIWVDAKTQQPTFYGKSHFVASSKGINYLELHAVWWRRFWVRSVLCPFGIALATTLITLWLRDL